MQLSYGLEAKVHLIVPNTVIQLGSKLQIPIKYNSQILFLCNNGNQIYFIFRGEKYSVFDEEWPMELWWEMITMYHTIVEQNFNIILQNWRIFG